MNSAVFLSSFMEVLTALASVGNLVPMLCLLGLVILGCAVGFIFYIIGGTR